MNVIQKIGKEVYRHILSKIECEEKDKHEIPFLRLMYTLKNNVI